MTDSNTFGEGSAPASAPDQESAAQYWTLQRRDLHAWMHRQDSALADLYAGALALLFGPPTPARVRFVSHAVREVCNYLPRVLQGTKTARFDATKRLDVLAQCWRQEASSMVVPQEIGRGATPDTGPAACAQVPVRAYREVDQLVLDWIRSREQSAKARRQSLFLALAPEHKAAPERIAPIIGEWAIISDYFLSLAHESGDGTASVSIEEFNKKFELFERVLMTIVGSFFQSLEAIDDILEDANN